MEKSTKKFDLGLFSTFLGLFFVFFALIFNTLSFFTMGNGFLLKVWANLLILCVSFFIALIPTFILSKFEKYKKIKKESGLFSLGLLIFSFFLLNILPFINSNLEALWSIYSIIIVDLSYILFYLTLVLLNKKQFCIKAIISLLIYGTSYFVITLGFANLGQGGNILVNILIFFILYVLITLGAYLFTRISASKDNQKKIYTKQF